MAAKRLLPILTTVFSVFALVACSGGGGGGRGGGGGGSSPPPPPSGVRVTEANAADVMTVGSSLIEGSAQIALAAMNPIAEMLNTGNLELDRMCGGSSPGTLNVSVMDNDGDGTLSGGDRVTVEYRNQCSSAELRDQATGALQFDVTDIITDNRYVIRGLLSILGPFSVGEFNSADVTGSLEVALIGGSFEILQVSIPGGESFSVEVDLGSGLSTERATALDVQRIRDFQEDSYSITASADINSSALGGAIACTTSDALTSSDLNDEATGGQLDCTGRAGSTARLDASQGSVGQVALQVDPQGDGTFTPVGSIQGWFTFVEGVLFEQGILGTAIQLVQVPELMSVSLDTDIINIIYAPTSDRVIATTPTGFLEINPSTMSILQDVAVGGSPELLALSDDETTLWTVLEDSNELQSFGYPAFVAGAAFPLGESTVLAGAQRNALQIEVAPGTSDLVVAGMELYEIVAYSGGTELTNVVSFATTPDNGTARVFAFRDATTIVAVDEASTGHDVLQITLDPALGLTATATRQGLGDQVRSKPRIGSEHVFTSERVFNEITGTVEGTLEPFGETSFGYNDVHIDTDTNLVYGIAGGQIDLYDENTLARIGRYQTDGGLGDTVMTPSFLISATPTSLVRFALTDIQPNINPDPCRRTILSGLWVPDTYIQLDCVILEAVYDPVRDLIYGALPNQTDRGNSIIVIDPSDLSVSSFVPLGGTAQSLRLSADGTTLFAVLSGTSYIAEINLDTLIVQERNQLGFDGNRPFVASNLAPTIQAGGKFVVRLNSALALFGDTGVIGTSVFANPRQFFVTTDGSTVIGTTSSTFRVYSISAAGLMEVGSQAEFFSDRNSVQRGDFIYEGRGTRFNMVTQSLDPVCELPPIGSDRVGPDLNSDLVYYAVNRDRGPNGEILQLVACNPELGTVGPVKSTIVYDRLGSPPTFDTDPEQVFPVSNGRIVIRTATDMVLQDRPDL